MATLVKTQRQPDGNTYDIYRAQSRSEALAFLRSLEIKEERRYAIVETPQGSLGKDLMLIFDEKTQEIIELGQRKPLTEPKKIAGRCCLCGYSVIPYDRTPDFGFKIGSVTSMVILSEAREHGQGFSCVSCEAICCAICAKPEDSPLCPLCRERMKPYEQ